jgi:hypothetical protein
VRRNPRHISFFTVVSAIYAPPIQPFCHQRKFCHVSRPSCEPLYAINTSRRKQETFLYEYSLHWVLLSTEINAQTTLLFDSTLLKHGRHLNYWNQPLNMRMFVRYLDCQEAELCCYLVIHIEDLLCPLQLFYFHLWYIYWLCLVYVLRCSRNRSGRLQYHSNNTKLIHVWAIQIMAWWIDLLVREIQK